MWMPRVILWAATYWLSFGLSQAPCKGDVVIISLITRITSNEILRHGEWLLAWLLKVWKCTEEPSDRFQQQDPVEVEIIYGWDHRKKRYFWEKKKGIFAYRWRPGYRASPSIQSIFYSILSKTSGTFVPPLSLESRLYRPHFFGRGKGHFLEGTWAARPNKGKIK